MADREGWTIMEERWTVCPARTKKLLVTISVRGKRYDKAKYILEAMPFIYRKAVWSCFFSCASAHSPELLLALTQHRKSPNQSSHPPGLSAASQYPFQWCYSLFLMHMQSSTICSLWPDILHTHSRPQNSEKSPGPHDSLSIQTLPCAWFLCSTRYWCKSLVSQGISIAFLTEGKVALTPANFWGV